MAALLDMDSDAPERVLRRERRAEEEAVDATSPLRVLDLCCAPG